MAIRRTMDRPSDLIDFGTDPYDALDLMDDNDDVVTQVVVSYHAPRDYVGADRWATEPEVWETNY